MALPVNEPESSPGRRRLRLLGLAVAALCLLALAAGTFVLSYPGARATSINAGVATNFARIYPGIFAAVLLVAGAAALSLRGAWRAFAWLVIVLIVGALAAADTVHVLAIALPKRPMEATAAGLPWVMLLVGLILLDAMVRQGRKDRSRWTATRTGYPAAMGQDAAAPGYHNGAPPPPGATATVPLSALLADMPGRAGRSDPGMRRVAPGVAAPAAQPTRPAPSAPRRAAQPIQPDTEPSVRIIPPSAAQAAAPEGQPTGQTAPPSATQAATEQAEQSVTRPTGQSSTQQAAEPAAAPTDEPAASADKSAAPAAPEVKPAAPAAAEDKPAASADEPAALGGRDDPSDADAEPSEPTAFFSRLRRSLVASGKAVKDGKPASTEPAGGKPAASEPTASSEPTVSKDPATSDPAASKEPAAQSPQTGSGS